MNKQKAISDEEIISAIIANNTFEGAAKACGISTRTIRERMRNADFRADYKAAKDEILRETVSRLNEHLSEAVDVTAKIMNDRSTNAAVRLQAAQTILNNAVRLADLLKDHEYETQKENESIFDDFI